MLSLRCKMMVKSKLEKMGLHYGNVELGEVDVPDDVTNEQLAKLKIELMKSRLELMDDKSNLY